MIEPAPILLVHAFATLFMVGLIWTMQLVHYPLFARVGEHEHEAYERAHMARISWIVGPIMSIEAVSAAAIIAVPTAELPRWMLVTGAVLLCVIWLSTATLQGPMHARLARGFDPRVHAALVRTNWIRTVAWTARGVLSLAMISAAGGAA